MEDRYRRQLLAGTLSEPQLLFHFHFSWVSSVLSVSSVVQIWVVVSKTSVGLVAKVIEDIHAGDEAMELALLDDDDDMPLIENSHQVG